MPELKYDGSEKEMVNLGLVTNNGVAIPERRNELNLYLKEVEKRNKYRGNQKLIDAGIVDKDGKVLDEKRLHEYEQADLDAQVAAHEQERMLNGSKPSVFKRATAKLKAMFAKKRINSNTMSTKER